MLHILIVRYTAPEEAVAEHVPAHVAYLERLHADGTYLLSGQTVPGDVGGAILARRSRADVERAAATDPFVTAGVAAYEILTVDAGRMHDGLRGLLGQA